MHSRPYALTIGTGGIIEEVDTGPAKTAGVQEGDWVVSIGTDGGNWAKDLPNATTSSSDIVTNIVAMPADNTTIKFARGKNFMPLGAHHDTYATDASGNASFVQKRYCWYFECHFDQNKPLKYTLGPGGVVESVVTMLMLLHRYCA